MAIVSGFGLLVAVACAGAIPADSWKPSATLPSNFVGAGSSGLELDVIAASDLTFAGRRERRSLRA